MKTKEMFMVLGGLVAAYLLWMFVNREGMTGYGVTSGLAFNNRMSYCVPGNDAGWSGGCFIPHRVIV